MFVPSIQIGYHISFNLEKSILHISLQSYKKILRPPQGCIGFYTLLIEDAGMILCDM